ncbi:MAG: hypothetical protein ISR58_13865 [Anaerolineales bacterium]|nr:hypothetical protein [bacterium]MBL6982264.1 hypothetical protein [Anaerolineales bacterium]
MDYLKLVSHDVFRYGGGLNRSGAEVYWLLTQKAMTAKELRERTGIGKSTIFRVLNRMSFILDSRTGEVISMVQSRKGIWFANHDVDLNHIALILGTAGIGKRKRAQYKREKREHKRALMMGRKLKKDEK